MIESIFILNQLGAMRFIKIYTEKEENINKEELIKYLYELISSISETSIIFDIDYNNTKRKLLFRTYGSIHIALIIDDLENELAILDFINVMMMVFDDVFKGVSELHFIMNPEKVYYIIDEMISGGIVIETNKSEILSNYFDKMKD